MVGKIKDFFFHGAYSLFICKKAYWELPGGPDDTTLTAESEEELRSLLMEVKEESEKAGLKLNIPKTKIRASGPVTSWQIDGETMETERLFSWAPKSLQMVTAAMKLKDTCSLQEKL